MSPVGLKQGKFEFRVETSTKRAEHQFKFRNQIKRHIFRTHYKIIEFKSLVQLETSTS